MEQLAGRGRNWRKPFPPHRPPSPEPPDRFGILESLRLQIGRLRSLRQGMAPPESRPEENVRADAMELLVGLLFADWTVARAAAETRTEGARFLTPDEIGEVIRRMEEVVLDGVEVDRMVGQLSATLDTLQNLGHPIQRYRSLVRLEKSQEEIHLLRERIRERRSAAVAGVESVKEGDGSLLLRDLGLYIKELGLIRSASAETREFTRKHFNILRKKKEPARHGRSFPPDDPGDGRLCRRTHGRTPAGDEETGETGKERGLGAQETAVDRAARDSPPAAGGHPHRGGPPAAAGSAGGSPKEILRGSRGGGFPPVRRPPRAEGRRRGRRAGRVAAGGGKRALGAVPRAERGREREGDGRAHPSAAPGGCAFRAQARRVPVSAGGAADGREGSPRRIRRAGIPGEVPLLPPRGRDRRPPGTRGAPRRGCGRCRCLVPRGGGTGDPDASAVARYMLAWVRFQSGDADGTVRELSPALSDPSFPCADPSPFEQAVLSLSVRAWRESPPEKLESYPPVKAGTCGGKVLLTALWEAEEKRGEATRAARVRDVAARRFPSDEGAAALEMKTVEALLRAGQDREALARALRSPRSTARVPPGRGSSRLPYGRGPPRSWPGC